MRPDLGQAATSAFLEECYQRTRFIDRYRDVGRLIILRGTQMKRTLLAAAVMLGLVASAPVLADQGDFFGRFRVISIEPEVSSTGTLSTLDTGVNNATVPEVDFTYMALDHVGIELILGTSRHTLTSSIGSLGSVGVLPPTLLAQYHFNPHGKIRPYVGAGMNYTLFYNSDLHAGDAPVGINNHSFGPALQAGVDIQVARNLFVNFDVKQIWMHTDATLAGQSIGTVRINPLVVGVGVGMKF